MTQIIMMTPDEVRTLFREELVNANTAQDIPKEAHELEILKRKKLLTPKEVQKLYAMNHTTLANKRSLGIGPEYIQDGEGNPVFYEHTAIQKYLDSRRKVSHE